MNDPLIPPFYVNGRCRKCGHGPGDHNDSLGCRVCKNPCGIDCSRYYQRRNR